MAENPCETCRHSYKNGRRSMMSQVVVMLVLSGLFMEIGMQATMPTLVIGALHDNSAEHLELNDDEASWFGSILSFSHPIGALTSGLLQERLGRKGSMLLVNIPTLAAWTVLFRATSVFQLYLVVVLMGISIGLTEAPLHSYIGEVGEPHFRGIMSTMATAATILGVLAMHVLGYLFPWRTAALISAAVPLISILCLTQIPESPTWLIMNGRAKDAQKALSWVRGWLRPDEAQKEFEELLHHTEVALKINRTGASNRERYRAVATVENEVFSRKVEPVLTAENGSCLRIKCEELTDKKVYRPLRMVCIVFFFSSVTELSELRPFMVGIFKDLGFPIKNHPISVLTVAFFFVGAMLHVVFLRRLGKRRLTLISQALATLSILLLGVYCTFFNKPNSRPGLVWIPISLMSCISFCGGFGISLIPWHLCAEVFPLKGRGTAQGLATSWAYYMRFVMSKTHFYLERWIKLNGVFFLYGVIAAAAFLYYLQYLPETEDKSLKHIETYFTADHDKTEKFCKPKHNRSHNVR